MQPFNVTFTENTRVMLFISKRGFILLIARVVVTLKFTECKPLNVDRFYIQTLHLLPYLLLLLRAPYPVSVIFLLLIYYSLSFL